MSYDVKDLGAAPIVSHICRQLKIRESINQEVYWDEKQCWLDPGLHVEAMIINILCRRDPLYLVEEFYKELDLELLFGPGVEAHNFNDDALGSTLDKIYDANPRKVFSVATMRALTEENISCRTLHGDTTARLLYGEHPHGEGLQVARGYNQEGRKDLKQIKIGLVTNQDGFPILGDVLDGNLDDKTWNKQLLENLPQHFNWEQLKDTIYVADSALVTEDSFQAMGQDIKFITRFPDKFKLATQLVDSAFSRNQWLPLGQLSPGKKSASYQVQEFTDKLYGSRCRFLVVHSNQLDQRKLKSLDNRLQKHQEKLQQENQKIMKQTFACEADAQDALERFLKEHQNEFYRLKGEVVKEREKAKRQKRGRPAKDEEPQYRDVYRIQLEISPLDEQAYQLEKERLSCFVLVTNIFDQYTAYEILKEYKQQTVVENRFKFIKSPVYVGPMWLRNNNRLEAMSYVILMALSVYIVLQRRVRRALEEAEEPLVIAGKKKSFNPTGDKILRLLQGVKIIYIQENGSLKRVLPDRFRYDLNRVLNLLGFDAEIFVQPRPP